MKKLTITQTIVVNIVRVNYDVDPIDVIEGKSKIPVLAVEEIRNLDKGNITYIAPLHFSFDVKKTFEIPFIPSEKIPMTLPIFGEVNLKDIIFDVNDGCFKANTRNPYLIESKEANDLIYSKLVDILLSKTTRMFKKAGFEPPSATFNWEPLDPEELKNELIKMGYGGSGLLEYL